MSYKIKKRHMDDEFLRSIMQMDLLWENASPTSAFAGQTIQCPDVGGAKYKFLLLMNERNSIIIPNIAGFVSRFIMLAVSTSNIVSMNSRTITINNGYVVYDDNYNIAMGAETAGVISNVSLYPTFIYGIK